jgi:Asp-tRNA(Asn)/Glu-tRNA(Gln) amidotransferase A subunit family amidase
MRAVTDQVRDLVGRDLAALTMKEASELLRRKNVSPVELSEACLARIDRYDRAINAFIIVTREQALMAARDHFSEAAVLTLAHAYEQTTGWHTRHPQLS